MKKNPCGKIPLLETEDGNVFESRAIMRHLVRLADHPSLMGKNEVEKALVNRFIDFIATLLEPSAIPIIYGSYGYLKYEESTYKKAILDTCEFFRVANLELEGRQYLATDSLTVADIYLAAIFNTLLRLIIDAPMRKKYTHLMDWFSRISKLDSFKATYGNPVYCNKPFNVEFKASTVVE